VFKGTTLRSMLLNAYAFGTMATIAGIAAIAAFIAAAVMLLLGGLGLAHARRVSPETGVRAGPPAGAADPATAPSQATRPSDHQPSDEDMFTPTPAASNGRPA
jgi:hypothetical protein